MAADDVALTFDRFFDLKFDEFLKTAWPHAIRVGHGGLDRLPAIAGIAELATPRALFAALSATSDVARDPNAPPDIAIVDFDREGRKSMKYATAVSAAREYAAATDSKNVLFNQIWRYVPGVAACKRYFEGTVGVSEGDCTAYAVLSRPGRGFPLHYDNQDVINIQLSGRKRWFVDKKPVVVNPLISHSVGVPLNKDQRVYWPKDAVNESSYEPPEPLDFVMEPGTVCFVPRGHWHRTEALGESLSLVLTYTGPACVDLLLRRLRAHLIADPAWRASLVGGTVGKPNALTPRAKAQIADLVARWAASDIAIDERAFLKEPKRLAHIDDVMEGLRSTFDASQAGALAATIQFRVTDAPAKSFYARVRNGACEIARGSASDATVTLAGAEANLVLLVSDIGVGLGLFQQGLLSVKPVDLDLINRLPRLFRVFAGG